MTSWIRTGPPKKKAAEVAESRSYFLQSSEQDFFAQFNEYLYSHLYAKNFGGSLIVYDRTNSVGPNYPILSSTFQDVSGIRFDAERNIGTVPLNKRQTQLNAFLAGQNINRLREEARKFFQLRPAIEESIKNLVENSKFLVIRKGEPIRSESLEEGVDASLVLYPSASIYSGVKRLPPLQNYFSALSDFQKSAALPSLTVFVTAADPQTAQELRTQIPNSTWTFYMLPPSGYQMNPSFSNTETRRQGFLQLVAEASIAQSAAMIVAPIASPIGRFLFLISEDTTVFKRADDQQFSPI
jgi:hypothetical protein